MSSPTPSSSLLIRFLSNHVLANLLFVLILVLGMVSYASMSRQQDPTVNFNWIQVVTALPGASADDVESKVTNEFEKGLENIKDLKFVQSSSREGISSILIRFNDIDNATFDKRVADVRRVIQEKTSKLPSEASDPLLLELTSSNAYPSATVIVSSESDGELLRQQTKRIQRELERLRRVDRVDAIGLKEPEIHIKYNSRSLANYQLTVSQLRHTIQSALEDIAPGDLNTDKKTWLVRIKSVTKTPESIAQIPIITPTAEIPLTTIAKVERARSEANKLVNYQNKPAILLSVMKKDNENTLQLVEEIKQYVQEQHKVLKPLGVNVVLADDQTEITRNAIAVMENNFLLGLILVLFVTWLFLGGRISLMTTLGIPFTVAGTFIILNVIGFTLNTSVLLGVVIALGMLVDDAVVVVESIYHRMRNGEPNNQAISEGIKEVFAPVTTSVLTTIAAFLPLMLLPGILGKFMLVVPLVVTLALFISLFEAYWLLPSHVMMLNIRMQHPNRLQRIRNRALSAIERLYEKLIIRILRFRYMAIVVLLLIVGGAMMVPANGLIKFNFFASDTIRLFYVNVQMPIGTPVSKTLEKVVQIEEQVRTHLESEEYRSIVSYAGNMFTETEPLIGKHYGQIQVSLQPKDNLTKASLTHPQANRQVRKLIRQGEYSQALETMGYKILSWFEEPPPPPREVEQIIDDMREVVTNVSGADKISFLTLAGGPPSSKPISMKLLGDNYDEIAKAVEAMKAYLTTIQPVRDIADDLIPGTEGLDLKLNFATIREQGINPQDVIQIITSMVDGIYIKTININNEQVDIRLIAEQQVSDFNNGQQSPNVLENLLNSQIVGANGMLVSLRELVYAQTSVTRARAKHYNFKRSITVEAELDKTKMDTLTVNNLIADHWEKIKADYPTINIDFSGELDDIQESLDAMLLLFIFGIGLIYLILGTQFRSYFQPFLVLTAIPFAFVGAILGILITGYALSLFTMYGIVALSGIAVNASIVMISTANRKVEQGSGKIHAALFAAKRRFIPISITTLTTVAGLFSLATGLGGESLIWGPVASAIVYGLVISSTLTLLFLPVIYTLLPKRKAPKY